MRVVENVPMEQASSIVNAHFRIKFYVVPAEVRMSITNSFPCLRPKVLLLLRKHHSFEEIFPIEIHIT